MTKGLWPSVDHSLLSPSGRMSKRARKAANDRETKRYSDLTDSPILACRRNRQRETQCYE